MWPAPTNRVGRPTKPRCVRTWPLFPHTTHSLFPALIRSSCDRDGRRRFVSCACAASLRRFSARPHSSSSLARGADPRGQPRGQHERRRVRCASRQSSGAGGISDADKSSRRTLHPRRPMPIAARLLRAPCRRQNCDSGAAARFGPPAEAIGRDARRTRRSAVGARRTRRERPREVMNIRRPSNQRGVTRTIDTPRVSTR